MWFIRRMMRISWIEKKSNELVLIEAYHERSLIKTIRQRQLPRSEALNYDEVKKASTKTYDLTEDGYWRIGEPEEDESAEMFMKAGAGVILTAPRVGATRNSIASEGPALEVTDNVQIKRTNASSGKRESCTSCDELRLTGRSKEDE
ncbi:hypothetical protein PoB_001359500 [Plakobranchus ocellatus]|uniref:Uncharacterized protein n=1 Tax=Plakobranchus ocellatus TaxID=259542 RepID=A0AAV3YW28_9GAST|nr:hypothetical protein PoB_001359500 [Plakobranchus ocellatus]